VAQSVEPPTLGFGSGHDLMGHEIKPGIRLHAQSGVCLKILSFYPSYERALSLSQINKIFRGKKKENEKDVHSADLGMFQLSVIQSHCFLVDFLFG